MANLSKLKRLQTWDKAETFLKLHLSEDKLYHYSHEWPERLTVNELAALQAMDSDILFSTWKYLISNSGMPVIIDSVRTVAGSGERSKGRNRSSSVFLQFPVIFEAPNMELETISPSDFADFLRQEGEEPSECIRGWFDAFGIVAPQAEAVKNIDAEDIVTGQTNTNGGTYSRREVEFEKLNIDLSLPLNDVFSLVIETENKVWHKHRQAKGATPEFINKDSFYSEFYKDYCKKKGITRKRGAPLNPK